MQKDVSGNQSSPAAQPAGAYVAGGPGLQRKLDVGREDDPQEREADAMAEQVLRMDYPGAGRSAAAAPAPVVQPGSGAAAANVQRDGDEEEERQRGISFLPPLGASGQWSRFGFDLNITHAQLNFGNPRGFQLMTGLNYPTEAYAAVGTRAWAFKLGYDFANNSLNAGGRYGAFNYGAMASLDSRGNPTGFGVGLGWGHIPLFNYNMRTAFQFGNTPLPYGMGYEAELNRTGAAVSNWEAGGDSLMGRGATLLGEAGNFASMNADLYDVASQPRYNWGAGINFGADPQLGFYFMAGLVFNLGSAGPQRRVDRKASGAVHDPSESGISNEALAVGAALENYINGLESSGDALPPSLQDYFERQFGCDFSEVRIHTGSEASESAESIQAKAYTTGEHIVFREGEYAPETEEGKRLLAHELTHVVQQSGGAIRKKEATDTKAAATIEDELRAKLEQKKYEPALEQLNDYLNRQKLAKKPWLSGRRNLRDLFLKRLPAGVIAERYTAEELMVQSPGFSFSIIDAWYPQDADKKSFYADNGRLFKWLGETISPYTGKYLATAVNDIMASITEVTIDEERREVPAFHQINLLAPTVEAKIELFDRHPELYSKAGKNFDPYTGISLPTTEYLNDADSDETGDAYMVYQVLSLLHEEQRTALYQKQAFKALLNADEDAEAYYKKHYKAQYKAIRRGADVTANMEKYLAYKNKSMAGFGFDRGIDTTWDENKGTPMADSAALLARMQEGENLASAERFGLLINIGVRAGLQRYMIDYVFRPMHAQGKLTAAALEAIATRRFGPPPTFAYQPEVRQEVGDNGNQYLYYAKQTAFDFKQGSAFGNQQRGTFDLTDLQDRSAFVGSLGGMRFSKADQPGADEKYDGSWLDSAVGKHANSDVLEPNVTEFKGKARRGKVYVSIRNDKREANIYAASLPFEGLNFFGGGTLYRSGPGVLQGLSVHLAWEKDTKKDNNSMSITLGIENIQMDAFELVSPKSTLAIGHIGMKDLKLTINQGRLPASPGFGGLFKNTAFTLNALLTLVPNVLKLLPAAVLTMVEDLSGSAHKSKDALGAVMKNDFNALNASLTFTSLEVRNIYDTTKGFIDNFKIGGANSAGNAPVQEIRIGETDMWQVTARLQIGQRIATLNNEIRGIKAGVAKSELHLDLRKLETRRPELIKIISEKMFRGEPYGDERDEITKLMRAIRDLDAALNKAYEEALKSQPGFNQLPLLVKGAEKKRLEDELEYLTYHYEEDDELAHSKKSSEERRLARQRKADIDARYKSADVHINLHDIRFEGGSWVRGIIDDGLKSIGLKNPKLSGLEKVNVGGVGADFRVSGSGTSSVDGKPGVTVRDIHIPLITADELNYEKNGMTLNACNPALENIHASAEIDFSPSPLVRWNPAEANSYRLTNIRVEHAGFRGLTLALNGAPPLLHFPKETPVDVWGITMDLYDAKTGDIRIKINDVKAAGEYTEGLLTDKKHTRAGFAIDTTVDNGTPAGDKPAFDVAYSGKEQSVITKLNIPLIRIPLLDIVSPALTVKSQDGTDAVQVKEIEADVKVLLSKDKTDQEDARPMSIEVNSFKIGEINAQGIVMTMQEPEDADATSAKAKHKPKTVQVVSLPAKDQVYLKNIELKGLRVTMDKDGPKLSTIGNDATFSTGALQLSGIDSTKRKLKGGLLQTIALGTGKFESLKLEALGRNGRVYSINEFFKFFGHTELKGFEAGGSYRGGGNSGSVRIAGRKDKAITVDFIEKPATDPTIHEGYYKIRLPLDRIELPAMQLKIDGHEVEIPASADPKLRSHMSDVDVQIRAAVEFEKGAGKDGDPAGAAAIKLRYDVYLDSLDIDIIELYGLVYKNTAENITLEFEKQHPLRIPKVKAGGFMLSSRTAAKVFGQTGGWVIGGDETAKLEANFEKIKAVFSSGEFAADRADGRAALNLSASWFAFTLSEGGVKNITLGSIEGGFPAMKLTQPGEGGKTTTTQIAGESNKAVSLEALNIRLEGKQTDVYAKELKAGQIVVERTEAKKDGTITGKQTIKLGDEALNVVQTDVSLCPDGSKNIKLSGIKAGRLSANLLSYGEKGKSVTDIKLPDPDAVGLDEIIVNISKEGKLKVTLVKPVIKGIQLSLPSQTKEGDGTSLSCDLCVEGNVELGDGNFDTMGFSGEKNAFIATIPDGVPVKIEKVHLQMKDSAPATAGGTRTETPLTQKQEELLRLEKAYLDAQIAQDKTPKWIEDDNNDVNDDGVKINPAYIAAEIETEARKKAFEAQKPEVIEEARKAAAKGPEKKYLDSFSGKISGSVKIGGLDIELEIRTMRDRDGIPANYVNMTKLAPNIKPLAQQAVVHTALAPFWSSNEIKAIARSMIRWYTYPAAVLAPTAIAYLHSIANGHAVGVVGLLLDDMDLSMEKLGGDNAGYHGLELNINGLWAVGATFQDVHGVAMIQDKYVKSMGTTWYQLFGFIEHLKYVSSALVSKGWEDMWKKRIQASFGQLEESQKEVTEKNVDQEDIDKALKVLIAYIVQGFVHEIDKVINGILFDLKNIDITADVTAKPAEVIDMLMAERNLGSLKLNGDIAGLHLKAGVTQGAYGQHDLSFSAATGEEGLYNIFVPGGQYVSADKGTKVQYSGLEISPVSGSQADSVLRVDTAAALLKGLKIAIKNKS